MKFSDHLLNQWIVACLLICMSAAAVAERRPVLQQIEVPHHYYFREMYLPQVSTGPQSPSWSPDGETLVYAMQGALWRQDTGSNVATQLTSGPGYDHQPDWSPDGREIVFSRYHDDAMELHLLDVESGAVTALTENKAVNVEPRWSPDGKKIAYVSTAGSGQFHVHIARIGDGGMIAERLTPDRRSEVERYYYSAFDHALSPAWAPDGNGLLYVANPEVPYGSGDLWYRQLTPEMEPFIVRREETTWRARPDIAPDGRRIVYSSYLGRQWHQLWLTTVEGKGEPFPLTYGNFDATSARWSPDGERIAFISNEQGNTALRVIHLPGGRIDKVDIGRRVYLRPMATLSLVVVDDAGKEMPARVSVVSESGRAYAPHDAWMHADDSFDRNQRTEEARYFHMHGEAELDVPVGKVSITAWHGMKQQIVRREIAVAQTSPSRVTIDLQRLDDQERWAGWLSGDVHVHMNYGGIYRNTPEILAQQARSEALDVVFNLIVNKEQRIPDIAYFNGDTDGVSDDRVLIQHSQEFHTGFWGHLALLGLDDHLLLPDYSAYPETAAASLFPDNATVTELAHEQGAISGYVHPFEYPLPDPDNDDALTNALPIDAALGKVDFYEVVGFADHRASADIWYRLLNCGLQISAAGGTDAMANFASLRGPVGMNRTFVHAANWPADPNNRRDEWIAGLREGRSFATNAPLLKLEVNGVGPGSEMQIREGEQLRYRASMRSTVPIDAVELVVNGVVVHRFEPDHDRTSAEFAGSIDAAKSGWLLLRASGEQPHPDLFDMYPYGTTSPVYVKVDGRETGSADDAAYFLKWIGRVRDAASAHGDYNSGSERDRVLRNIDRARAEFEVCLANAR